MPEQALQVAFEIKTACDEISRRLLRWHWERKPGAHSLDALLEHIAARKQESPDYYDRMPDLSGKTSWQQLDTTLCMRVLLDPETDAARPLDLLGNTVHPSAARHACNAIRTARNEAAHAAVAADGAQAALLFNEAIEALEEGYAGTAFKENELAQYYREAINNATVNARNQALEAMANPQDNIFYLNVNEAVMDANGCLDASLTSDGIHLLGNSLSLWENYLKQHAIVLGGTAVSTTAPTTYTTAVTQSTETTQ